MALGNQLLFIIDAAVFCAAVRGDIVFHVAVGQAVVVLLLGVLADVPLNDGVGGVGIFPSFLTVYVKERGVFVYAFSGCDLGVWI